MRIKYTYVNGDKYPLISTNRLGVIVQTDNGPKQAYPRYIGWTFVGFGF